MLYPTTLHSRSGAAALPPDASDLVAPGPEAEGSLEDDLRFARRTNVNVLVVGSESQAMDVVGRLIADTEPSVVIPCHEGLTSLARVATRPGTLVFQNIDALDPDGQRLLFRWLHDDDGRRQIVSTASKRLILLLEAGGFDRALYYRLNTVYIELAD